MKRMIHLFKSHIFVIIINFLFFNSISYGYPLETTDHLKEIIQGYVQKNTTLANDETMEIKFDQVNALQLHKCSSEVIINTPATVHTQEITSVELSCNDVPSWHVYVPVHVAIFTKVYVAKETISPREVITAEMIELQPYEKNRLYNGFYKNDDEVIGQVTTQLIQPGYPIDKKNCQAPVIVHRNDVVDITVTKNTVSISMKGIAKSDGAISNTIKVYNPSSKKTIDAIVMGPNRAEVL